MTAFTLCELRRTLLLERAKMSRLALVTGSTSGIGLGIARVGGVDVHVRRPYLHVYVHFSVDHTAMQVLAGKGHDVILHGFGTSEVIQSAIQTCRDAAPGFIIHPP